VEREIKMALGYKEDLSVRIENLKSLVQSEEGQMLLDRAEKFVIDSVLVNDAEEREELIEIARRHVKKSELQGR
jgi:hypothetical protein